MTLPAAREIPSIIHRRLTPFDPRGDVASWYATAFVVFVAAVLRFAGLSQPAGKVFDETYYAREGWALLTKGVEWNYKDNVASYVVHPPLGKWLISVGEWAFGYYDVDGDQHLTGHLFDAPPEFGWRFSVAVAGIVSVLLTVRIARRLFGSTLLGCAAGLLMAFDGFHLVLSRTALLDIFLLLFILATFGALVIDRDTRRAAWLRTLATDPTDPHGHRTPATGPPDPRGRSTTAADATGATGPPGLHEPRTGTAGGHGAVALKTGTTSARGTAALKAGATAGRGVRATVTGATGRRGFRALVTGAAGPCGVPWWRLAAAVLFACAVATKWNALFFLPAFVALILWWEAGARRSAGRTRPWRDTLVGETKWLALCGGIVFVVYLASWSGWLLTDHGYFRHWLADNGQTELPVIGALQNLFHYHHEAFKFHSTLQSPHPSQSWPWQWLLLGKPVTMHLSYTEGAWGQSPVSEVLLLGTPLLWWSFLPAMAATLWLAIARRDWRPAAILLVAAAGLLPWFYYAADAHRVMYSFYTAPAFPFMVFAVVYVLGAIIGPAGATGDRRLIGAVVAGAYVVLVVLNFAYFYAIFVGQPLPYADWADRMWLGNRWR